MTKPKIDYVNEYLATARRPIAAWMVCTDGTTLSVQASERHYCTPESDTGPWTHVEVWCVSDADGRQIRARSFGDRHDDPYACVPVEKVNAFIKRHGGLA